MRTLLLLLLVAGYQHDEQNTCTGPLGPPISVSALSKMTACCQEQQGKAHCLANVPEEIKGQVAQCSGGGGYCIPDSLLESGGAVPPASCKAFGGDGVCLSKCIPDVAKNAASLAPDTCTGADELCVPCINP